MRYIESDDNLCLRGDALKEAIEDDIKLGLIPFWVSSLIFPIFYVKMELINKKNTSNVTTRIYSFT